MRRLSVGIGLVLICLIISAALAQDEAEKAIKYRVGVKYMYGNWAFESSEAWHKGIEGRYDMTTTWGLAGPTFEVSLAKDHIGVSGHYFIGHFDGDYSETNNRYPDSRQTAEKGSIRARREDIEAVLRLTPHFRYVSLLMGYKWLRHCHFEKRGHGTWNEYVGIPVPAGNYTYDITDWEENRIHGFLYGIALESPKFQQFYAWGNGAILPNLNIKYNQRADYRFDDPSDPDLAQPPDREEHLAFLGRLKGFETEIGLGYSLKDLPLDIKLSWWLQRTKAGEPTTQSAPVWNERLSGGVLSLAYTF